MNLIVLKKFFILLLLTIILKSVTVWSSDLEKIKIIKEEIYLDKISFFNFKNEAIKIKDEQIEYYILNFWASWCAPCIKEMKSLNELKNNLSEVKILSVSQDADLNDAKNFFNRNSYDNIEKYYDYDKNTSKNFSLRGLPTTFIFTKNLKVLAKVEGIIQWDSDAFINWLKKN